MFRFGPIFVPALTFLLPALPAAAQASCSFRGGFAQLAALIPDRAGTCTADEQYRPDRGRLNKPSAGSVTVLGGQARRGNPQIGYVPQRRTQEADLALRGERRINVLFVAHDLNPVQVHLHHTPDGHRFVVGA